jgi:ComF family protein
MIKFLSTAIKKLNLLAAALKDFLFFYKCLGCGKELDEGYICKECLYQIMSQALVTCPVCGFPKYYDEPCIHPLLNIPQEGRRLARIRALGRFSLPYNNLIYNLKYHGKTKVAKILGLALANLINSDPILSRADYMVPIPLHQSRLRERDYNQAELLAKEASGASGIMYLNCLKRKRNTRSQTQLSFNKRVENVKEAFVVKKEFLASIHNRRIILIDDVITSGATLGAAGKTLLESGAGEIYAAVIAATI